MTDEELKAEIRKMGPNIRAAVLDAINRDMHKALTGRGE